MSARTTNVFRLAGWLLAGSVCLLMMTNLSARDAAELPLPGKYRLQVRISMPNLEENLRSAGYEKALCVSRVADFFPVLLQPAFDGCRLRNLQTVGNTVYQLDCPSGGSSGELKLSPQGKRWRGRLAVKMGAKNMTFSQHVIAEYVGRC